MEETAKTSGRRLVQMLFYAVCVRFLQKHVVFCAVFCIIRSENTSCAAEDAAALKQ